MSVCGNSLFDNGFNYIKLNKSDFVAVEGSNTMERLMLSGLRIPYTQILKGKIILKKGEQNYLLNHLGLGDNVTFLAMKVIYDFKSVIKEDNYLTWSPYDNLEYEGVVSEMMVLTGNTTKRIPQLFISNPNEKYSVRLEVMLAIIDDESSFFDYRPVVYFTNIVDVINMEYIDANSPDVVKPYNTTVADEFQYIDSFISDVTKGTLVSNIVNDVRDSNNNSFIYTDDNFILKNNIGEEIGTIDSAGEYYLTFNITDSLGNSLEPVKSVKITFTDD
jgi:hypothetical protein